MRRKNIKAVLAKKHKEFVESIADENVRKLVAKNSIITGGCIVSMLQGEKPHDFDYYFKDMETAYVLLGYLLDQYNKEHPEKNLSVGIMKKHECGKYCIQMKLEEVKPGDDVKLTILGLRNKGFEGAVDQESLTQEEQQEAEQQEEEEDKKEKTYKVRFISDNAISLSNKIQIIFRFWGTVEQIHENFDFIHCTCSWDSDTGELILPPQALEAILARELVFMNSKYPLCAIIRTRKFIQRGWMVNAGQYVKMALLLNTMNLLDPFVLEDQLTGVDSAYFMQVIRDIQEKQTEDPNFKIDNAYLFTVLDRIFN